MKKIVSIPLFALSLFASSEYVPVSELSNDKKVEYNFVNKSSLNKQNNQIETNNYKNVVQESNEIIEPLEEVEIKETKVIVPENIKEKKEVIQNTKTVNKTLVKEYKNENILKDEVKLSDNTFSKDFSVTPKLSYMRLTLSDEEEIGKTNILLPEIAFKYKNHILKTDYMGVDIKYIYSYFDLNVETSWYRLAYLYNFYNANIGLAYNNYKVKASLLGVSGKDTDEFVTLEIHAKNKQNHIVAEYGGFYGKNDSDIENAYEYYLNLGYEVLNNDKLVFTLGYKNRTIEFDDGLELEYKGPTLGISSTF